MIVLNSENFNDEEIKYLKFSNDFNIEILKKIKIILGPNGIGKTSIYRNIKKRHPEYGYIDYNEIENSIITKGDKLIIAPSITEITKKEAEKEKIINSIDTKKTMKEAFEISNKAKSEIISKNLNNYRNNTKEAINKFKGDKLDILIDLGSQEKEILVGSGNKIFDIVNEEIKLDKIKNDYRRRYLESIEKTLNGEEYECPVCGSECEKPIKNIIEEALNKIEAINNEVIKDYINKNPDLTAQQILDKINKLKKEIISNNLEISDLEDYLICGGNKEKAAMILDAKNNLPKLEEELKDLDNKKIAFYNNIKAVKDRIIGIFKSQLDVSIDNINFDDDKKELEIKLSRPVEKHSTGEINLITFAVSLLEFIGSDKNTLIIDDPLSSYDIPNQYKIIYEITAVNNDDNRILLFTHNIDCINIANSQNISSYEYELIDNINGTLYLNKITNSLKDSGFSIKHILKHIDNNYQYKNYLKLLSEKDNWESSSKNHKIFHYDSSCSKCIDGYNYDNNVLVDIIDSIEPNTINNNNYLINSANKIMYLAALRVWIEKKFTENTNDLEGLKEKQQLSNKIIFMFDGNHWIGPNKVTKSYLMSKKVMLNQNDHFKSQKEPFYFALSLSTEEIIKEIIDIKEHFLC